MASHPTGFVDTRWSLRLFLPLLALSGCSSSGTAAMRAAPEPPQQVVEVAVDARVRKIAAPAAWAAQARVDQTVRGAGPASLKTGQCQAAAEEMPSGGRSPQSIQLAGPLSATLDWDADKGHYATTGPREALDPAWAVGSVRWVDPDGVPREALDAVRFGSVPVITRVERAADGSVRLGWDALSVDAVELHTNGPAGPLVCGSGPDGSVLPWWAVPAVGGEVIVRSVRERTSSVGAGVLVVVRAAIERVVSLDRPAEAANDQVSPDHLPRPLRGLARPKGPRRSNRPTPPPMG